MAEPSMKDVALAALEMGRAQSAHYTHLEEILGTFDNQPTKHMLQLIANDLMDTSTHRDVKRARANWLRHFITAIWGN